MRSIYLASIVAIALAAPASAEDRPDPLFASWSNFKPGAAITVKTSYAVGKMTTEVTFTTRLRDAGRDKLVLETSGTFRVNGQEGAIESTKSEVPKGVAGEKDRKSDTRVGGKPEGTFEEGTETLTVGGAKVETRWYKFKSEADGVKTEGKVWVSDAVPGGVARQELTTVSGVVTARNVTEVVEFKKP